MAFPPLVPAVATEHQVGTRLLNELGALTTLADATLEDAAKTSQPQGEQ
jgi:hypothetical protein